MSGFNTSTRREDVSLKLRSQNMRHTREQTKKLEEDSRKMEDRLNELKTAMSREKEERERQGGGFWDRGQTNTGSLTSYASEVLHSKVEKPAKEGKKKKIKVLRDEPIELPKRSSQPGTVKYIAQRKLTTGSTPRDKQKGPKCGQCEERSASLSCVQCSEIYCAGCFAAFHLKGALKQHRSCPLSAIGGRVSMSPSPRPVVQNLSPRGSQASGSVVSHPEPTTYPVDGSEASGPRSSSHNTPRQAGGATLLQGDYDESESASSFQQALMAWRQGDEEEGSPTEGARKAAAGTKRSPVVAASPVKDLVVGVDCSTGTPDEAKVPDIKFTGSLSYVEKLMLKKHRRTDVGETGTPRLTDQSGSSSRLSNQSDFTSTSRYSHQKERNVDSRESRVVSPLPRKGYRDRRDDEGGLRERSFIDDGERVDFQSLYEAVVSADGSGINTPRSGFSVVDVTNSPLSSGVPRSDNPVSSTTNPSSYDTQEVTPYESWLIADRKKRESSSRAGSQMSARESARLNHPNNNHYHQALPDRVPSTKPYSIEDMFPRQSPSPPPPPNQQDEFSITPRPTSAVMDFDETSMVSSTRLKKSPNKKQENSFLGEERIVSPTSMNETESPQSRPKSSKAKSRPKTANKSRPASRAQSRAASRMMMAEGLLTKTPSKALSQVANLADSMDTSAQPTYQSNLEGFFLAGVDMAAILDQAKGGSEERVITPRQHQQQQQSPKSRGGQAALKSARGERETIKVSNRLYQMAPRSWRPESSLGETVPVNDVVMPDQEEMVLAYSYSGQISGRATQWRPSSSQSSIAPDNPLDGDHLNLPPPPSPQSSSFHRRQQQPSPTPTPTPTLPQFNDDTTTTSIPRSKSALRRSLGRSLTPAANTPTPKPTTPANPSTPSIPTNKTLRQNSSSSLRDSSSSSLSMRHSKILNDEDNNNNKPNINLSSSSNKPPNTTTKSKASHLMGNLLPSKSEIPFTTTSRSKSTKSKITTSGGNERERDSDYDYDLGPGSHSRSNTQTSEMMIKRSGTNISRAPPSRPSSKSSGSGLSGLSRRHSNADETSSSQSQQYQHQHQQQQQQQRRPNSSSILASDNTAKATRTSAESKGRPNSSTDPKGRPGRGASMMASQSVDLEGRQDSIIADVMSTRIHHADGWMMGEEDDDDDCGGGGVDMDLEEDGNYVKPNAANTKATTKGGRGGGHGRATDSSSQWETEVRPFTRDSLDSANVRGGRRHHHPQGDQHYEEKGMGTRPSSTMSGRESRAIEMDGEDLSVYDNVLDVEEQNQEDKQALEQLEWELASDTGRLTADGQISRLEVLGQEDYSGSHSSSRSSSGRSLRFCADKEYDLTSKLLEDERLAEQDSLNVDLERHVTMDEYEVKALR